MRKTVRRELRSDKLTEQDYNLDHNFIITIQRFCNIQRVIISVVISICNIHKNIQRFVTYNFYPATAAADFT